MLVLLHYKVGTDKEVSGQTGYYEEDESVKLSREVSWAPSTSLVAGTKYKVIVKKELQDYANKELLEERISSFTTAETVPPIEDPLPNPNGNWGQTIDAKDLVDNQKKWTIKLSKAVNEADLQDSIYIVNDKNERIIVQFTLELDGKHIVVLPPENGYSAGNYYLMILENLKDIKGNSLKKSVLMPFTVK